MDPLILSGYASFKDKLGLQDPDELSRAEVTLSAVKAATCRDKYRPTSCTFETMAHSHRWLFQTYPDWAISTYQPRTGVMVKTLTVNRRPICRGAGCTALDYQFGMLADEHFLQHLGREELVGGWHSLGRKSI